MRICIKRLSLQLVALVTIGSQLGDGCLFAEQRRVTTQHADAKLTVTLSNDSLQIAEPCVLEVRVLVPDDHSVQFPKFDSKLGELDILDAQELRDLPVPEGRLFQMRWTIESLQAGERAIPSIALHITNNYNLQSTATSESGKPALRTIETQPIKIEVRSAIEGQADPTKFRDIHSVVDVTVPTAASTSRLIWGAVVATAAVLAIACTALFFRRRPQHQHARWATAQINSLRDGLDASAIDHAVVLGSADAVLRQFLVLQFDRFLPAQTTEELLEGVNDLSKQQSPDAGGDIVALLRNVFETADAVKYAGQKLESRDIEKLLDDANRAIEVLGNWQVLAPSQHREAR